MLSMSIAVVSGMGARVGDRDGELVQLVPVDESKFGSPTQGLGLLLELELPEEPLPELELELPEELLPDLEASVFRC